MTAESLSGFTWHAAKAGRFSARALGSFLVFVFVVFAAGEGIPSLSQMTLRERISSAGVIFLVSGLIGADIWEGIGGAITILGWILLAFGSRVTPWNSLFTVAATIGIVHVLASWRLHGSAPAGVKAADGNPSQAFRVLLWLALVAPLLLCVNEILGEPPLTAPSAMPSTLIGKWSGALEAGPPQQVSQTPIAVAVAADRSVTGSIGNARILDGQLVANRTWFGRLLHWRTDYLIRGSLSQSIEAGAGVKGARFTAPVNLENSGLAGSLFLSSPGKPMPVRLWLSKHALPSR